MRGFFVFIFIAALFSALPSHAPAAPAISLVSGDPGGDPVGGVPEIPAGAAPIIVAGIVGAVMLVRNRRNKGKK